MDIGDLLGPGRVIAAMRGSTKKQVLQELARRAATQAGLHERAIFDKLWERERIGSTGMGMGTAIPHARIAGIAKPFGMFARLEKPIDFEAVDERPVDLIFLLLTPEDAGADHLKALARISRLFRDRVMCEKLRGTDNADALTALLTDRTASHAA
ncbi:MAG TPA: PTS IIA-like nitrogen regulatory protein PtsN [Stellaceae bacterium]|nr:PTS IIA-like nitrogen regulatory protein PtsN [Stellaceae bacterium]